MDSRIPRLNLPLSADLLLAVVWLAFWTALIHNLFSPGTLFYFLIIALSLICGGCVRYYWPSGTDLGWANRVTLFRGVLVFALVSLAPLLGTTASGNLLWFYGSLCLVALVLDGVDGYVARATGTETAFGARFDMELDALFILGLCFAVMALDRAGPWVLALGLMRYGFLLAGYRWPFLLAPLPASFRRKTVCVWQLVTLMVAILPVTPDALAFWSLVLALVLLGWSFGTDIRWLYLQRRLP